MPSNVDTVAWWWDSFLVVVVAHCFMIKLTVLFAVLFVELVAAAVVLTTLVDLIAIFVD